MGYLNIEWFFIFILKKVLCIIYHIITILYWYHFDLYSFLVSVLFGIAEKIEFMFNLKFVVIYFHKIQKMKIFLIL
jgi:hypothetical protein